MSDEHFHLSHCRLGQRANLFDDFIFDLRYFISPYYYACQISLCQTQPQLL